MGVVAPNANALVAVRAVLEASDASKLAPPSLRDVAVADRGKRDGEHKVGALVAVSRCINGNGSSSSSDESVRCPEQCTVKSDFDAELWFTGED